MKGESNNVLRKCEQIDPKRRIKFLTPLKNKSCAHAIWFEFGQGENSANSLFFDNIWQWQISFSLVPSFTPAGFSERRNVASCEQVRRILFCKKLFALRSFHPYQITFFAQRKSLQRTQILSHFQGKVYCTYKCIHITIFWNTIVVETSCKKELLSRENILQ